jgi:hypothetical protein
LREITGNTPAICLELFGRLSFMGDNICPLPLISSPNSCATNAMNWNHKNKQQALKKNPQP